MMFKLAMIALGGMIGALLRYGVSTGMQRLAGDAFPLGTLVVNVSGCLAIGVVGGWLSGQVSVRDEYRLLLVVGLLGSFTTFSTFGWETMELLQRKQVVRAVVYVLASNALGLLGVWAGMILSQRMVAGSAS